MPFDTGISDQDYDKYPEVKEWPTYGKRTLLLDADFIAYLVGFCSDMTDYLSFKNHPRPFESDKWLGIKHHVHQAIDKAVRLAGCDSVILFLTDSESNFRLKIAKTVPYKGQRITEKPPFFREAKDYMLSLVNSRLSDGCEADDEVSIEAWKRITALEEDGVLLEPQQYKTFADFVIASQDKDLDIIPSWHCHPTTGEWYWASILGELKPKFGVKEVNDYTYWPTVDKVATDPSIGPHPLYDSFKRGKRKGEVKMKRVLIGKKESQYIKKLNGTGLHFFYSQLITGDVVDNYKGLDGCGCTVAYELLNNSSSEQDLFDKVTGMYKDKIGDNWFEYFLEQARLAHMQVYRDELWDPVEKGVISYDEAQALLNK